jgi:histidine triad (HIT) family protein
MNDCIFCSIIRKTAAAEILYEDDLVMVIRTIKPLTPLHLLIIPRKHYTSMNDLTEADAPLAGHMLLTAKSMAERLGISEEGYRLVINTGAKGGQTVFHLHLHLMGGKPMTEALQTQGLG